MEARDGADAAAPTLSVCVVTYERAAFLDRCLAGLAALEDPVEEVVVVDASAVDRRGEVDAHGLPLRFVWAPYLAGWMTRSRNEALRWVSGDVVAFLDDDVVVGSAWSRALREAFGDASVAAVAGRTRNGIAGEEHYDQPVGRYLPTGRLTEGFAVSAAEPFEVDHGIGANMSFRRSVLADLGGFRDDYPGTALREDTDVFLRVRRVGGRVLFAPDAVVDHLPAPHVKGARFDTRYKLYGRRNHVVLLARHRGLGSADVRRWVAAEVRGVGDAAGLRARTLRLGVTVVGVAWGLGAAVRQASWGPAEPRRTGSQAQEIRARLSR
ncbi:glycosyltransferase family 2 protein [Intrasporangium flavum]|uniref:glycosyltransferase family 2 protein n=1 Tax=Intrasporangium flavum TaxID=1428657 RepID=UPI00096DE547|nr:glycosyltransferase family 2 protein [Intrasporangium flavum]